MAVTRFILLVSFTLALSGTGCEMKVEDAGQQLVRVALLPDESQDSQKIRYQALFDYLADVADVEIALVEVEGYGDLLTRFGDGDVDLALFGGYTFIRAQGEFAATPLVMRDTDLRFRSSFIVVADESRERIADFQGEILTFGSKLSTSGHLMPRHYLESWQVTPEQFFSQVLYSGSHDKTIRDVSDGRAVLGVANSQLVREHIATAGSEARIKILRETPPYPDYVWAVRGDMPEWMQARLRDAFLSLTPTNREGREILNMLGAGGFLPARAGDFSQLASIVRKLESD